MPFWGVRLFGAFRKNHVTNAVRLGRIRVRISAKLREDKEEEVCEMYVIVGLGNPTLKYAKTRHNVGFDAVDLLGKMNHIAVNKRKFKGLTGQGKICGEQVVLVKPQTFMNLSGECVREVMDFYKVKPESGLVVLYDDIYIQPGELRIRQKGSAGGHNGMKNIIAHLKTQDFVRIRIGVGEKPEGMDLADYVLQRFPKAERAEVDDALLRSAKAVEEILSNNVEAAMNKYNQRKS